MSYRRDDTRHVAGRLFDRLAERFGDDNVFMDIDSIEPGLDFGDVIERAVSGCAALLVLIGRTWLHATDEHGQRRLDDPHDLVVLEVKSALNRNIRVIPVLVDGAAVPRREDLPEVLGPLARRNAVRLDHETFRSDIGSLIEVLDRAVQLTPAEVAGARTSDFDVVLTQVGEQKIPLIKLAREYVSGLGLKEAKDLIESDLPVIVASSLARETAERMRSAINQIGGRAEISADGLAEVAGARTSDFDVVLTQVGKQKIPLIKLAREYVSGLGLKEAKDLIESDLPVIVASGLALETAKRMRSAINQTGGRAEIR